MLRRLYDLPIWLRLLGVIWLILVFVWSGMIGWAVLEQRDTAQEQAGHFAGSLHEMTWAGLTTLMITGTMDSRHEFMDQIQEMGDVRDLRAIRAASVTEQWGEGTADSEPRDAVEREVLDTGEPFVEVDRERDELRVVKPIRNHREYLGRNCMACHGAAEEDEVLGATSMRLDMTEVHEGATNFGIQLFGFAILVSLPLLGAIFLFIRRFVTQPLAEMTEGLRDIAGGGGDLTRRLDVHGDDEVGRAARAFNDVMEQFRSLIGAVVGSSGQLTSAAEEVSNVSDRTREGGDRQRREIEQVATSMNEMSATAQDVARNSQSATEAAHRSLESTRSGQEVVQRTVTGIEQLASEVHRAAEAIQRVEQDSESIGKVLQVIQEIAEQTNLLALNAAIEAARAGEAGRGFAVVADEVRALASRTHESTEEIRRTVETLQGGTRNAVEVMQAGEERARATVDQAGEAGSALEDIREAVQSITEMIDQIASAAEQQSQVAETINRNVTTVTEEAEQNAEGASQASDSAAELMRLARELQEMTRRFRV
ncbi:MULTISPECIES: methyl-accepting chemotaxis protein [unclassified Thioalkalivibrio]|uniref:methyl-accepting chemotaxis protein n=1 Tax=unclassified Thioalkalivibrio TaxID=2621013 RepID=UPI00036BF1C6|nr:MULTISPECIES: methyl-accepting chemotaxis protein [unclassified Thioalkalivibrio]